jgi:hypothetical protein
MSTSSFPRTGRESMKTEIRSSTEETGSIKPTVDRRSTRRVNNLSNACHVTIPPTSFRVTFFVHHGIPYARRGGVAYTRRRNPVSASMSSLEKGQNGSEIDLPRPTEHSPERRALEKKLLRKIDLRMSILIGNISRLDICIGLMCSNLHLELHRPE